MAALSATYPRYGYRRIRIFLERDGHAMSFGRAHRLWRRARLQVPRSGRQADGHGATTAASADGGEPGVELRLRVRLVRQRPAAEVPDGDRRMDQGGLAIEVDGRIRSARVIEVLSRLVSERGAPRFCVPTTVRSSSRGRCCAGSPEHGIDTALIDPGKPWQNGARESFNGKFRDECLGLEWFRSRAEAKVVIETLATALQRGAAAFEPRLSDAGGVRRWTDATQRHDGNGPGRCGIWSLRAPARCIIAPSRGKRSKRGGRLKLAVVRRSRAGQRYRATLTGVFKSIRGLLKTPPTSGG